MHWIEVVPSSGVGATWVNSASASQFNVYHDTTNSVWVVRLIAGGEYSVKGQSYANQQDAEDALMSLVAAL